MLHFHLINLILFYFGNTKLSTVVLFHCLNKESLINLSYSASEMGLYTQFVNLNRNGSLERLEYRYMFYRKPKIGVFLDLNCQQATKCIEKISKLRYFNEHFHWLIYDQKSDMKRFKDIFTNVNISVDTEISYVIPEISYNSMKISNLTTKSFINYDVYSNGWLIGGHLNITPNYEIHCERAMCWKGEYLSTLRLRSKFGNRQTLTDVTMRVAVVVTRYDLKRPSAEINEFLLSQKDFHIDPLSRLGFQILRLLRESLNTHVTYEYFDRWTDVEYSGGIVGALVNDTADLTSAPFFTSINRFKFLTPIAATGDFRSVCMFRTPRNSGIKGSVFLQPFSRTVWFLFAMVLFLAAVFLWLIFFVEYHKLKLYLSFMPSFLTASLISFGSACSQSSALIPRTMAGRITFFCLSLLTFIMYNYYTSVVVSSLLGSPVKSNIKTISDLADSNLEIGLEPLPYTYTYLNFSTLPDVRRFVKLKIEAKKDSPNLWFSANDGIIKMRDKPGFVFVFETSTGYNLIEKIYSAHEICDLNEILFRPDTLLTTHLHHNSSYKEIVRLKILRILETGIHRKHRLQWVRIHLNCFANNFIINVGMEYAAPLFFMLLSGYAIVLFIFIVEIIWHRYELKRLNRNKI